MRNIDLNVKEPSISDCVIFRLSFPFTMKMEAVYLFEILLPRLEI
jgi:hypothetical protein